MMRNSPGAHGTDSGHQVTWPPFPYVLISPQRLEENERKYKDSHMPGRLQIWPLHFRQAIEWTGTSFRHRGGGFQATGTDMTTANSLSALPCLWVYLFFPLGIITFWGAMGGGGGQWKDKKKNKEKKKEKKEPSSSCWRPVSRFWFLGGTILAHLLGPMYLHNISQDPRVESAFPKLREELQKRVLSWAEEPGSHFYCFLFNMKTSLFWPIGIWANLQGKRLSNKALAKEFALFPPWNFRFLWEQTNQAFPSHSCLENKLRLTSATLLICLGQNSFQGTLFTIITLVLSRNISCDAINWK